MCTRGVKELGNALYGPCLHGDLFLYVKISLTRDLFCLACRIKRMAWKSTREKKVLIDRKPKEKYIILTVCRFEKKILYHIICAVL